MGIKASTDAKVQHKAPVEQQSAHANASVAKAASHNQSASNAAPVVNTSDTSVFNVPAIFQSNPHNRVLQTIWSKMNHVEQMRVGFAESIALARKAVKAAAEESPEKAVHLADSFEEILSSANNAATTSHPILLEKIHNMTKTMHLLIAEKLDAEHHQLVAGSKQ